jgi:hypothetical protein
MFRCCCCCPFLSFPSWVGCFGRGSFASLPAHHTTNSNAPHTTRKDNSGRAIHAQFTCAIVRIATAHVALLDGGRRAEGRGAAGRARRAEREQHQQREQGNFARGSHLFVIGF